MEMIFSIDDLKIPRMQWAILTAMAVLCEEFSPEIQEKYHKE